MPNTQDESIGTLSSLDAAMRELESQNYRVARSILEKLFDDREAQLQLAYLYQQGLRGGQDEAKARKIYEALAEAGDPQGMFYLGSMLLENGRLSEALSNFERAAKLNHVSSAYWAAASHDGLNGHPRDGQQYQYFITRAAELGHFYAIRDISRSAMKCANSPFAWLGAFVSYLYVKAKGFGVALRNPHDMRLR